MAKKTALVLDFSLAPAKLAGVIWEAKKNYADRIFRGFSVQLDDDQGRFYSDWYLAIYLAVVDTDPELSQYKDNPGFAERKRTLSLILVVAYRNLIKHYGELFCTKKRASPARIEKMVFFNHLAAKECKPLAQMSSQELKEWEKQRLRARQLAKIYHTNSVILDEERELETEDSVYL